MAVHVSIHDVSPAHEREVEEALHLAHEFRVRPALLVVPNFHGEAPLADHPDFCKRLVALEKEGHEVYLHGYYHQARAWSGEGMRSRLEHAFAQTVVSGGEAEFSDVTREEAETRLDEGARVLRDAGLSIRGFVAPAWSMPKWVLTLLASRGYGFTEDHMRVYDPAAGTSRLSLVLNYASRTPSRLLSSVAYCRAARPVARLLPTRIAIHPADMRFAFLRAELRSMLAWAQKAGERSQGRAFVETGRELLT